MDLQPVPNTKDAIDRFNFLKEDTLRFSQCSFAKNKDDIGNNSPKDTNRLRDDKFLNQNSEDYILNNNNGVTRPHSKLSISKQMSKNTTNRPGTLLEMNDRPKSNL